MNILTIILLVIICIVAAFLVIGLFTAKSYVVEREMTISKDQHEVFKYIRYLKNQDNYNKWVMMDPGMRREFKGIDGTEGFIYRWYGNKRAGAGEQEIKRIVEGKSVDIEIRFSRPFKGTASAYMETGSIPNPHAPQQDTSLKWVFTNHLSYPMNIMLLLINFDKILGKDIEVSLQNLKAILENKIHGKMYADKTSAVIF